MKKTTILFILTAIIATTAQAQCWQSVSAGYLHTLGIKADGTLWAWGSNYSGQLGDGTFVDKYSPVQIGTSTKWQSVAPGFFHTLAVKTDGTLWAWGDNDAGQLGDGTATDKSSPVQIGIATNWQTLSAGIGHSLAIKTDGTLWAWGQNADGQLGDGTYINNINPVQIGSDTEWQSVSAGANHSLAIKTDGTLWAWGWNEYGQVGDGTIGSKNIPIQISTATNWQNLDAGRLYSLAIKSDGTLWAWGNNEDGQLGDGTIVNRRIPLQIGTDTNWQSVSAESFHSLAIKTDGTLWAWGDNEYGQLGDGTIVNKRNPVQIGTGTDWKNVSAGKIQSHAIKTDGTGWAWGSNYIGQLGIGTNEDKNTPTEISPCPSLTLPYDICSSASSINHLRGGPVNTPQTSNLYYNNSYNTSGDPATGFECFYDNQIEHSIWYTFTGDGNKYRIRSVLCNATFYIHNGDTQAALYTGACDNLAPVLCNDDEGFILFNFNMEVNTQQGTQYYLLVDGNDNAVGQFCLEMTNLGTSAVTEIGQTNIRLSPNPTTGIIGLEGVKAERVEVYDQLGRLLRSMEQPGNSLDISGLPTGVVFLKMYEGGKMYSARVVKE